ncbi:ribosomal protein S6 kinase delta-1 [Teleopsis dalmanni]|uniref:ribosomal protein S6 kinase delta-1 n=1 Tax=Teleopsis dalmanni TaxID=139649 RepID=UPI0018CDEFAA|nr:ribosomal protein S6 kinase delta-1 [Teleopsis dalmanni]
MVPNINTGGWIHSFTVTDTQTHKNGYTIYKITSIVFPRSVPQALTCLTIWKRFHDIKRLHRELSRRHKGLNLHGELPEPTDCSYFKRFNADVIQRRKEYILELLDFAAQHPALYKCHAFANFFSDAQAHQTPSVSPFHQINFKQYKGDNCEEGAIAQICDKLDILYDPFNNGLALLDPERDIKEKNDTIFSDTIDGIETVNSEHYKSANLDNEIKSKDYTRFLTPMASIESDDSDYIYEAALEFSNAVQAEVNLDYLNAHSLYKRGVELLLCGSKDDSNEDRKYIAKAKISKYLARADDIYDKFLKDNIMEQNLVIKTQQQLSIDVTKATDDSVIYLERPWNHLSKYKVIQILGGKVMQVQSITEPQRPMYVMKGIEKPSSISSKQTIFLPQNVPYMVDLIVFFQSEQKIFLLLSQATGGRLYEYIKKYNTNTNRSRNLAGLFSEADEFETDVASNFSTQDSGFVDQVVETDCAASIKDGLEETQRSKEYVEEVCSNTPSHCDTDVKTDCIVSNMKELEEAQCNKPGTEQIVSTHSEIIMETACSAAIEEGLKETQCNKVSSYCGTVKKVQESVTGADSNSSKIEIKDTRLPEASIKQWARELAVAIQSLHENGIILSDLHMKNLLLGSKGQLQLSYFYQNEGLEASNNVQKALSMEAIEGHYVAPEISLTFKSDWWSYGVLLYQLLLGVPFKAMHPGNIELYYFVQYPHGIDLSEHAKDLLNKLLQRNPEDRYDYQQIQVHSFFNGTNWEEVKINGLNNHSTMKRDT